MSRITVVCAVALVALNGCSSDTPRRAASMSVLTEAEVPPETLKLRIAAEDGSGFVDAGTIVMTPQTQAFMSFMRVGGVSLTPDGRIVSFTVAGPAPANMPEGYEESYASIITDRYGNLLGWNSLQPEVPPAKACVLKRRVVNGQITIYCQNNSCTLPKLCTIVTVIGPETGTAMTDCECYAPD